jgi:SsrA-binding protein
MTGKNKKKPGVQAAAVNRRARFNYEIGETFEAGIALRGSEVKSLRAGRSNIGDAFAGEKGGELWLYNAYIPEYLQANIFQHETRRARKLLLHKREISKLIGAVDRDGMTIVPLKIYFNDDGRAKVEIAVARGKKLYDKRETEKKRSWDREKGRLLRDKG